MMDWTQAFLADMDDRADAKARREREAVEERVRRFEQRQAQQREDRVMRAISEPGLERALDRAAVGLTAHRMRDLEVKIGESLAQQVKDGVRETFNEMSRKGHRAYIQDEFEGISHGVVRSITIVLPQVGYRIYQRADTWEWAG